MIRVGLVGYGLAGSTFHEPLIRACGGLELAAALTSRDHPRRIGSFEDLLERSDLVVIASPNQHHFPQAKAALEQGKHVVVDKPFTVSLDEADELIALADRQQRVLTVFHNRRWDGDFQTVRRSLPELGEVLLYEANWDRFRPSIKHGWREVPERGAGILNDLGPHLIDQALQLFGMPEAIAADVVAQRDGAVVDDYFDVTLEYGRLRACLRCSTLMADPRPRFALHGTQGSYVKFGLDPQEAQLKAGMGPGEAGFGVDQCHGVRTLPGGKPEAVPTERGRYLAFYEAVAAAVLDGAPVPVDPRDARAGLLLIELARRASDEGRRLAVPDASSKVK
ncbi:MAG: Gfo/Idh/MocA family oxidoreductase [Pseudomonadota bacterium]